METYLDGIRNTYGNQYPEVDTGFSGGYYTSKPGIPVGY
jgi:hypothetical protein